MRFADRGEYFARTKGLFFYAFGERGLTAMKTFLDQQDQKQGTELPGPVRRLKRQTPPGWNAAAVLPTRILHDSIGKEVLWEIWRESRWLLPPGMRNSMTRETLMERSATLAPILARYRLDRFVLLGGFEPRLAGEAPRSRARLRLIW